MVITCKFYEYSAVKGMSGYRHLKTSLANSDATGNALVWEGQATEEPRGRSGVHGGMRYK